MRLFIQRLENIKYVRLYAVLISVGLSIFALNTNNPPFEIDGFFYLYGAQEFLANGLRASLHAYNWPFYQITIALLSQVTSLSFEHSAYILDSCGIALACFAFISIMEEIESRKSIILLAALTFLIFPSINISRKTLILRDYLYWGFCFTSLWLIIRHSKYRTWTSAWGFAVSSLLATLFRIEGSIFLLLLPMCLTINNSHWKQTIYSLAKCYSLHFLLGLAGFLVLITLPQKANFLEASRLSTISEHLLSGLSILSYNFKEKAQLLNQQLFIGSEGYIASIATIIVANLFIILLKTAGTLGPIFSLLILYAFYTQTAGKRSQMIMLYGFIGINIIINFIFILENGFLASRYVQTTAMALLLFVPYGLFQLTQQARIKGTLIKRFKLYPIILLALALITFNGLYREKYSKAYIVNSGYWLKQNTPSNSKILSSDAKILYYSSREGVSGHIDQFNSKDKLFIKINPEEYPLSAKAISLEKNFDYLVLSFSRHEEALLQEWENILRKTPIKIFAGNRGNKIAIFKIK